MSECINRPGIECQSALKVAQLEERVKTLEVGQEKESDFRETYYKERLERVKRDAELDSKISSMDGKLDKLVEWQETQKAKPGKRWEGIVDKAIWAILAAFITYALAQIGIV